MIFATTTPVIDARHQASKPFVRKEADVEAYNRAALAIMKKSPHVAIDDLHALAMRLGPESVMASDGVHFTKEGSEALGEQVAAEIKKALKPSSATREAACRWAEAAPVIDGKLDDPAWADADRDRPVLRLLEGGGGGPEDDRPAGLGRGRPLFRRDHDRRRAARPSASSATTSSGMATSSSSSSSPTPIVPSITSSRPTPGR